MGVGYPPFIFTSSQVALALLLQLRSLSARSARPDVVTFSAALAALNAARWRWALELLLLMATDQARIYLGK